MQLTVYGVFRQTLKDYLGDGCLVGQMLFLDFSKACEESARLNELNQDDNRHFYVLEITIKQ